MPIYEYRCIECGEISEYLTSIRSSEKIQCPKCRSEKLEKIISRSNILNKTSSPVPGKTGCGREERCETPTPSEEGSCRRD